MATIGQSISQIDLLRRANDFQSRLGNTRTNPYQAENKAENDWFVERLQDENGGTLSEMKAAALEKASTASGKQNKLNLIGYGALAAGAMLPYVAPQVGNLLLFAGMGVFAVTRVMGSKVGAEAQENRRFAARLGEWQRSIDAAPNPTAPPQGGPAIGGAISRADLLQDAKAFRTSLETDPSNPYQRENKELNDFFVGSLNKAPEGNLAELQANASRQSSALNKKAAIFGYGGLAAAAAMWFTLPVSPEIRTFAALGTALAASFIGARAGSKSQELDRFAGLLDEWKHASAPADSGGATAQHVAA